MYELYGDLGSGSATVELLLCELGLEYETRSVSLHDGSQRSGRYARMNPQRKIPALVTGDGDVVTESVAILLWLLERHPGSGLLPQAGSPDRAEALRWLLFMATELYPIIEIIDYPERFAPEPCAPQALRDRTVEHWRRRWRIVEDNIRGPWLLGEPFGICDIYLAVVSRWADQAAWIAANLPKVERVTRAVGARSRCRAAWKRHFERHA